MPEWIVRDIYEPASPEPDKQGSEDTQRDKLTLDKWSEEDQPREKLMRLGAEALSSAELLAILIRSGSTDSTAVDLMKQLLHDCGDSLAMLGKMSLQQLMSYKGIGEAKALSIIAACELGKRRQLSEMPERTDLSTSEKIYQHLWPMMRDLDVEEAHVVLMNQAFKHIKTIRLSHGGITETAVDVRVIMKEAVLNNATIIALAHNHPSGKTNPSRDDDMLTKKVSEACKIMRIHFADHIIVTDGDYYSYREEGRL